MNKRSNKFDTKIPTPIALVKKGQGRVDLQTRLRKIDQQFHQNQEYIVPQSSSTYMISNLKQELSHIKQDVQKLMVDDEYQPKSMKIEPNNIFKQELAYQKGNEQQLKKEIRELKTKNNELTRLKDSNNTAYMIKQIEVLKRQQSILLKEKYQSVQIVNKLKRQMENTKASQTIEKQLSDYKHRYQKQKQQKQQMQLACKRLQNQNSRLIYQLSSGTKQRQSYQNISSSWKQQKHKLEYQISTLKLSLTNSINNGQWKQEKVKLENQIQKLKMQLAIKSNNPSWKQQKMRLQEQINKYRQLSVSTGDQWKQQKIRLENEISKLQIESKRNKQLLDSKYKANKQQMVSSFSSIKDLTQKNYEFIRKINNMQMQLVEKSEELRKKQQMVIQQKQQIKIINRQKDARYNNLMSQFKRLEQTFNKSAQQNQIGLKNTITTLQNIIRVQQGDKEKLKYNISQLNQKIQRLTYNIAQQKKLNEELQQKVRLQTRNSQQKQVKLQKRMSYKIDQLSNDLMVSKRQVSNQQNLIVNYMNQIKQLQFYKNNQQKLKLLQIQKLDINIDINQLRSQILNLKQRINNLQMQLIQKSKIISRYNQSKISIDSLEQNQLSAVESKYRQIIQQQNHTIEQNQSSIMKLENQVIHLKEHIKRIEISSNNVKNSSFDDIFKEYIRQNQQLKLNLKNRIEEILKLKNSLEDYRRRIDFQKNQSQIDKLKNISDQKKIKSHFEIQIQNISADMQSQKRKHQALQARLDVKIDQLKKKDQFIQNVIIGKVGKDAYPSELQYITKEVHKFFNINYGDKLLVAEDQINLLKEKIKVLQTSRK